MATFHPNCAATFRNSKTGKSRTCGKPAQNNGYCAKHQWVYDQIMRVHGEAVKSLEGDSK